MHGVNLVIHAAALKRVEVGEYDSAEMVKTNVIGTMNVIEAATSAGVQKVVSLSSDKACEPCNCYGASKLLGEKLILAANNARGSDGPIFAAVRYGNVAGSTGSVIPIWRKAKEQGETVMVTDPDATRFWMRRSHAVQLVIDTSETMIGGELVIPELPSYRLADLAEAMRVRYRVTKLGVGEKLHESLSAGNSSDKARRMSVDEIRRELEDDGLV
jgi:UDP-N-acetylglucosamine 4,6-dehydratase